MKIFEIWCERFQLTGQSARASYFGREEAETFKDACIKFFSENEQYKYDFDANSMTHWACKLFDNENDARKSFG